VIPFIVQFGLYISPVGFSSQVISAQWRLLYHLNPIVGVIDGFRWCILGGDSPIYWPGFTLSLALVVFFLWLGVSRFRNSSSNFGDQRVSSLDSSSSPRIIKSIKCCQLSKTI